MEEEVSQILEPSCYHKKGSKRVKMDGANQIYESNRQQDVSWLCSLSESELDFLISLKKLAIQRAKICGHEELADKFDLKMLRVLGVVLMEDVRKRVQDDTCLTPSVIQQLSRLDDSSLLEI